MKAIVQAVLAAIKGFWKTIYKAGVATFEWVRETLSFSSPAAAVAPAATGTEAAPLDVQRAQRQAVLDASDNDDRRRGMAIAVRAGARALLREQTPVGVPEAVCLWMRSLGAEKLSVLAAMAPERILDALDGKLTALGTGYHPAAWEARSAPVEAATAPRPAEQATSIIEMKSAMEARAQERLQRRLRPLQDGELLKCRAVRQ